MGSREKLGLPIAAGAVAALVCVFTLGDGLSLSRRALIFVGAGLLGASASLYAARFLRKASLPILPNGNLAALSITLWLAWIFGLAEASQHHAFRFDPLILTVTKVDANVFWVAPVVYLAVFLAVLLAVLLVRPLWGSVAPDVVLAAVLGYLGGFGLITLTNKVHIVGAFMLSLGTGLSLARFYVGHPRLRLRLARWFLIPIAGILLTALSVSLVAAYRERAVVSSLPAPRAGSPNIVFVVLDTVRADHLSLYGYARPTTPQMEALAQSGVVFDNAWSVSSWTMPSHGSMFTGLPAFRHRADRDRRLDAGFPVLAEFLADRGYATAAFSGNSLWINPQYGFDRGFAHFEVYSPMMIAARTSYGREIFQRLLRAGFEYELNTRLNAANLNQRFFRWADRQDRPFFAFLNYFDAHDPYWIPDGAPSPYAGAPPGMRPENEAYRNSTNRYDTLIQYADARLGELRAELERRNLLANAIFIVTSDHGESLGDHGQPQHGKTLYQEVTRVPLLVAGPGLPAGKRIGTPVSVQEIPSSLAKWIGAGDSPFPPPSLARFFDPQWDANTEADTWVLAELQLIGAIHAYKAVIEGEYQLIWDMQDHSVELFHTAQDPRQLTDLSGRPEALPVLQRGLRRLREIFPDLKLPPDAGGAVAGPAGSGVQQRANQQ